MNYNSDNNSLTKLYSQERYIDAEPEPHQPSIQPCIITKTVPAIINFICFK
jgi:hypothetical protein